MIEDGIFLSIAIFEFGNALFVTGEFVGIPRSLVLGALAFGIYSIVVGLVASPFGALGAYVAWLRIRQEAPASPA